MSAKDKMGDVFVDFDASAADQLTDLKKQIDEVSARMTQMDQLKAGVADAVYLRVRADYDKRLRDLQERSGPLKVSAQKAYSILSSALTQLESEHEAMDLDRQEVEFRHQLGEFDTSERKSRLKAIDEKVASKAATLETGRALRERFLAAVNDESELLVARTGSIELTPSATREVAPIDAAITGRITVADLSTGQLGAVPTPPPPPIPDVAGTLVLPAIKAPRVGEALATGVVRLARLVPQNPEAGGQTAVLGVATTRIGSDAQSEVRVGGPGVDARHAEIVPSTAGYLLRDHGSRHGTRVNAERVKERLLINDDVIQIGAARFVFRLA